MKKILILLHFFSFNLALAQSIVCGQTNCAPTSAFPSTVDIQEKATHSAIDLNFLGEDLTITSIPSQASKNVKLFVLNGELENSKNLTIDLSSSTSENNSSSLVIIGDNFNNLNIKLNGFSGASGKDASEICAENIQSLKYGTASNLKFLQNRSNPANGLVADRCGALDVSDLGTDKFACDDPNFIDVSSTQSISVDRVLKVNKCVAIIPQPICVQPAYQLSCNYEVYVNDPTVQNMRYASGITDNSGGAFAFDLFLRYVQNAPTWDNVSYCGGSYPSQRASYFANSGLLNYSTRMYDGVSSFYSNGDYVVDYTTTQQYTLSQTELNNYYANGYDLKGICENKKSQISQALPSDIQLYVFHINQSHGCDYGTFSDECRCENRAVESRSWNSSFLVWKVKTNNPITLTSPGLDATGLRLSGGNSVSPANTNAERSFTNAQGWKMDIMNAFAGSDPSSSSTLLKKTCNDNYSLLSVNALNITKHEDVGVSANPCSTMKSCDSPVDSSDTCVADPSSLATYNYIGLDSDPQGRIETVNCSLSSCPVENRLLESNRILDTLVPTNGENGTAPGYGLIFIYDTKSSSSVQTQYPSDYLSNPNLTEAQINSYFNLISNSNILQSSVGQSGAGGRNDLSSPTQIKYCAKKRDASTDPNSNYKNEPSVEFKRVNWKVFDVNGGGLPGNSPPFTGKKIHLYKKIDPGILYLLKKELL